MKFFLVLCAIVATVSADVSHLPSSEYLPPVQTAASVATPSTEYLPPQRTSYAAAPSAPVATYQTVAAPSAPAVSYAAPAASAPVATYETDYAESAPAHTFSSADGYRYKTNRRVVLRRHRRDVSHLPSNEYLPPVETSYAASEPAPAVSYAAPAQQTYQVAAASAPVASYENDYAESAPAHTFSSADGYRYKTNRRVVLRRHRRDVSHLPSSEYLPPVQTAATVAAPSSEYLPPQRTSHVTAASAPVATYQTAAAPSAPAVSYAAPAQQTYQETAASAPVASYETDYAESAPAHTFSSADGYRYKTNRRVVLRRHRRDVSHLPSNEYLPPVETSYAASEPAPAVSYAAPAQQTYQVAAASAPVASYETDYAESAPAHTFSSADGYRYKTNRRVVLRRHRRDVSHLPSNEYLPPVETSYAASEPAPAVSYAAPAQQTYQVAAASAPVASYETDYAESAPAHTFSSADGYRYKTNRRVVLRRHRRDVSHLPSSEYLPPVQNSYAASESVPVYHSVAAPAETYAAPAQQSYQVAASAPVASYETDYAESAPAHTFSATDGYRYKTSRRRVIRRRN